MGNVKTVAIVPGRNMTHPEMTLAQHPVFMRISVASPLFLWRCVLLYFFDYCQHGEQRGLVAAARSSPALKVRHLFGENMLHNITLYV